VRTAAVGLLALVSVLAFGAGAGARTASGLRGVVMEGPTTPVCQDDACEKPAAGIVLQFKRSDTVVAEVKTSAAGKYFVRLRPGSYAVKAAHRRIGTGLTPRVVRVPLGHVARVDFFLDTGIQ
jgi:hypothetical protein